VRELRLDSSIKEEIVDWQYEAKLQNIRVEELFVFPYNLTFEGVVEEKFRFIEKEEEEKVFPVIIDSTLEESLYPGDKIVAISGEPVDRSYKILSDIQKKKVLIIVDRKQMVNDILTTEADRYFDNNLGAADIEAISKTLGRKEMIREKGTKVILKPIVPMPLQDLAIDEEKRAALQKEWQEAKKEAESIDDSEKRNRMIELINARYSQRVLGLPDISDLQVIYNPVPTEMYSSVFGEIRRTLGALFSGHLSPKWLSGPIGIVSVVQHQGMSSLNDALFWLGAISLNLGFLNLLPIPMLDGGTILFSLFEWCTGVKIKPKTMERLILPFAILLILFFVFVTYHDLLRLLSF
jgi:regulator of sigma E protease